MCTPVNFTGVNKIETMFERSRANVKVEPRSTFAFTRGLSYIASISFTCKFNVRSHGTITRQWKSILRERGKKKKRKIKEAF